MRAGRVARVVFCHLEVGVLRISELFDTVGWAFVRIPIAGSMSVTWSSLMPIVLNKAVPTSTVVNGTQLGVQNPVKEL